MQPVREEGEERKGVGMFLGGRARGFVFFFQLHLAALCTSHLGWDVTSALWPSSGFYK